jgi:hypothetical protein
MMSDLVIRAGEDVHILCWGIYFKTGVQILSGVVNYIWYIFGTNE